MSEHWFHLKMEAETREKAEEEIDGHLFDHVIMEDMNPLSTVLSDEYTPKIRMLYLYADDYGHAYNIAKILVLDEGQDFDQIYADFNKQDMAMSQEEDEDGPAHQEWKGLTDFLKERGVKVLDYDEEQLWAFQPNE